jgi:hypothetical protein
MHYGTHRDPLLIRHGERRGVKTYLRNRKTNCYKTENAENKFAAKQKTN